MRHTLMPDLRQALGDDSEGRDHVGECRSEIDRILALLRRASGFGMAALLTERGCEGWSGGEGQPSCAMLAEAAGFFRRVLAHGGGLMTEIPSDFEGAVLRSRIGCLFRAVNDEHACVIALFDTSVRRDDLDRLSLLTDAAGALGSVIGREKQIGTQNVLIRAQERELAQSRKVFERSSAVARIGVWECDLPTDTLQWTDTVYDIFDLPRGSEITRELILPLYAPESLEELDRRRKAAIASGTGFTLDARIRTAKGNERWIRITATVESENGLPARIFGMKQDITEERRLSERTRYLAEFDVLTGLANRSQFQTRLAAATERGEACVLLLMDLDGFKQVNDTYGHAAGDICLKEVAARLAELVDRTDIVARLGGDEFAIVLSCPDDIGALEEIGQRIIAELRKPIQWADQSFQLGVSIGIAISQPDRADGGEDLLASADTALYAAKTAGKNRLQFFDASMRRRLEARISTIKSISRALARNELLLHYQPKFATADMRLTGFEALLRWRAPDGRVLSAGAFQEAFDDPELSQRLGQWVMNEALGQAARWRRAGLPFDHVAINVSSSQLGENAFAAKLLANIEALGLEPRMIEVEITEGVFLHDEGGPIFMKLQELQAAGVRIALDDFGTGYASLVHLRGYPLDTLKIDRSFIENFLDSKIDASIVESIVYLGHRLEKHVIAEGVETKEQLARLRELGCTYGQGFLFSRPITAAQAEDLMRCRVACLSHVA